jgi:hypothetical protein
MKNTKEEWVSVKVPTQMKKELQDKADKDHRSLSSYLRVLFRKVIGR